MRKVSGSLMCSIRLMNKPISIIGPVLSVFIVTTLITFVYGLIFSSNEYFYLSIFLGGPLLFGLLLAARTKSDLLIVFALAALVSGWLAPLGFFWERDKFTYGGQSGIKDFQFFVFEFIGLYIPVLAGYFIILSMAIIPFLRQKKSMTPVEVVSHVSVGFELAQKMPKRHKHSANARFVFVATVLVFAAINWWMFTNSIGITGINPPELPFKLSGILYYTARFVLPIILVYLMTKFRPTSIELSLLVVYACFASLTSVSKATLFLLFMPALIIIFLHKRFFLFGVALVLFAIFYPVVGVARNFVYLVEGGISIRNIDFSLIEVLSSSLLDYTAEDLFSGPLAIIERIGGGQDVVLAAQYDSNLVAGPIAEFIRLYIFDFLDLASTAQGLMYDYTPDVLGYATGDGGFFAHMLLAGGDSVVMMLVVSLYQGALLSIANSTYMRMLRCRVPRELVLLYAIFFCIFFFALSIPLWLNSFVIVTSVIVRTKAFRIFFEKTAERSFFPPHRQVVTRSNNLAH